MCWYQKCSFTKCIKLCTDILMTVWIIAARSNDKYQRNICRCGGSFVQQQPTFTSLNFTSLTKLINLIIWWLPASAPSRMFLFSSSWLHQSPVTPVSNDDTREGGSCPREGVGGRRHLLSLLSAHGSHFLPGGQMSVVNTGWGEESSTELELRV